MEKALIAMSGGVDSSVAAYLMLQAGCDCCGMTLKLWDSPAGDPAEDAKAVADRLQIPFRVLDHRDAFLQNVVHPFIGAYEDGMTPNPCIQCNQHIKFGVLLDEALHLGYSCIVTGHYARIRQGNGRYVLFRAADPAKDQTYFLAGLNQHQLSHIRLPLGELTKEQVRAIAEEQGFLNARKKDSQDICFIPDGDYRAFLQKQTDVQMPPGDFVDITGRRLGRHNGLCNYTVGQRKGLGIALGAPVYVCRKDMDANTVTVGPDEALYDTTLLADDWNWYPFPALTKPIRVTAKVRYRHTAQSATAYPEENGYAKVVFDEPQRAITAGQAVVLYDGDLVVGGGTIRKIL